MIYFRVLFCYGLLPLIMTNPYYPIFEGQPMVQSAVVSLAIYLYSAVYIDYKELSKNGISIFLYMSFLQFIIIFPISLVCISILYVLYYSLILKFIIYVWLPLWFLIAFVLEMEKLPLTEPLQYKIAGCALIISIYLCILLAIVQAFIDPNMV
jgi:hypothetical protein